MAYVRIDLPLVRHRNTFPTNADLVARLDESGFSRKDIVALDPSLHDDAYRRDTERCLKRQLNRRHRKYDDWKYGVFCGRVSEHGADVFFTRREAGALVAWVVEGDIEAAKSATDVLLCWLRSGRMVRLIGPVGDASLFEKRVPRRLAYLTVDAARTRRRRTARRRLFEALGTMAVAGIWFFVSGTTNSATNAIGFGLVATAIGLVVAAFVACFTATEDDPTWHHVR